MFESRKMLKIEAICPPLSLTLTHSDVSMLKIHSLQQQNFERNSAKQAIHYPLYYVLFIKIIYLNQNLGKENDWEFSEYEIWHLIKTCSAFCESRKNQQKTQKNKAIPELQKKAFQREKIHCKKLGNAIRLW